MKAFIKKAVKLGSWQKSWWAAKWSAEAEVLGI